MSEKSSENQRKSMLRPGIHRFRKESFIECLRILFGFHDRDQVWSLIDNLIYNGTQKAYKSLL